MTQDKINKQNSKILIYIKAIKNIIDIFATSFLMYYFYTFNGNTTFYVSIYFAIVYVTIALVFVICSMFKKVKKTTFIRLSLIFAITFLLSIALLSDGFINYFYIVALLYGIEQGLYYSGMNIMESNIVDRAHRVSYYGRNVINYSIISLIIPIVFGSALEVISFVQAASIMAVGAVVQLVLLGFIKNYKHHTESTKHDYKGFFKLLKNKKYKAYNYLYANTLFHGMAFSSLAKLATLYLITSFPGSGEFGFSAAAVAVFGVLVGLTSAKLLKPKRTKQSMVISAICIVIVTGLFVFIPNLFTILLFNITTEFCGKLMSAQQHKLVQNSARVGIVDKKYQEEDIVVVESWLDLGRVISYVIMAVGALFTSPIVLSVIIIFTALMAVPNALLANKAYNEFEKLTHNHFD